MGEKTLKTRFKNATNTENNWKSKNPVLLNGEIAYSSDVNKFKVGNGTSKWADLPYSKAQSTDSATMASKLQTYKQGSTTETYGTSYPLYAQWENGNTVKLKCDGFSTKTDLATTATTSNRLGNAFTSRQTSGDIDFTNSEYVGKVSYFIASSLMTTGKPPMDSHILNFGWDSNAGWGSQLALGTGTSTHLYLRGASGSTNKSVYGDWKIVLDTENYNNYVPTKTGTGASGTWGIGITGNAATATRVNGHTVDSDVPANAVFTDTTYTSKTAKSGGTDVSLVTTGEKAIWDAKGTITGIKMNGASKGTSGVVDLGTVLTSGKQTTTSTADGGSNVYTFSDNSTITVKNGSKGSAGTKGTRGSVINYGTAITGTSTTATIFSGSGLTSSLVGDMYMNTSTSYLYRCTVAGNASTAKWVYIGSMKGATGTKGDKGDPGVNATTTSVATTSANGLMSKNMVTKLNGIASGATAVSDSTVSGWGYLKTDAKYKLGILSAGGTAYPIQLNRTDKNDETGANSSISLVPGNNVTMSLSGSALTINARDSTYSTGTASTSGLTKLYTTTGTNTDGTLTQSAINSNYVPISNGKLNISNSGNAAGIVCSGTVAHGFTVKNDGSVDITGLSTMDGKTYDTGWKTVDCGNGISAWSTGDAPRIRRVGKTVELVGIITNSTVFSAHDNIFKNIPTDMRPSRNVWSIQEGHLGTTNRWMMTINPGGTVSFDYYGVSVPIAIDTGMCIPVHAVWMVD